jgi:hypothetical protein
MQKTFWSFDDNVKSSVITEKDNTTNDKFAYSQQFDLDILMGGDMKFLQLGLGGSLCNYSCPWCRVHKNQSDEKWIPNFDSMIKKYNFEGRFS